MLIKIYWYSIQTVLQRLEDSTMCAWKKNQALCPSSPPLDLLQEELKHIQPSWRRWQHPSETWLVGGHLKQARSAVALTCLQREDSRDSDPWSRTLWPVLPNQRLGSLHWGSVCSFPANGIGEVCNKQNTMWSCGQLSFNQHLALVPGSDKSGTGYSLAWYVSVTYFIILEFLMAGNAEA